MTYSPSYWSPSKLAAYEQCPAEFHRRYVLREPIEPNAPMFFGTAIHKGLEAHFSGQDGDLAFRRAWRDLTAQLREAGVRVPDLVQTGLELIEQVAQLGISGTPERKVWANTTGYLGAWMLGYVDLWDDQSHTIYDFKTTVGSWSEARAEQEQWQPCIYSWAYWQETGVLPRFEYIVLNRGTGDVKRFNTQRTHDQIQEAFVRARDMADAVKAQQWGCTCGKHQEAAA